MARLSALISIWKVIFAATALIEVLYITLLMRKNDGGVNGSESDDYCRSTLVNSEEDEFTINYTFVDMAWESTLTISQIVFVWIGPFFCSLCLVEALVRAVEARSAALDSRALDDLEESLLQVAQKSTIRLSMLFTGAAADQTHKEKVTKKVSKALRSWVPAIATISFWLFVLPTDMSDFHHRCGSENLRDSAVFTQWLKGMSMSLSNLVLAFHGIIESFFWSNILPYRIHKQPQRFIQRIQVILRWIRFGRFAGPLFRMGLKLQDQIRAFWRARRQSKKSDLEKQRRLDRPSMIFSDIQNLFQKAKQHTALAQVPSFSMSPRLNNFSRSVVETYSKRRAESKNISDGLTRLQKDYLNFGFNNSFTATSELYDRIVKMSQDIATTIHSERRNFSHRYVKSLRSLLYSRKYLISPRTRFSLAWRMTVTNCLMLEISRLCASWYLSGTFSIPLSQVVGRLLVECKTPEKTKHHLEFITNHINQFRRHLFDMFLFGPPPVDIAVCIPSGPQALLILHFSRLLELFVDAVVFMDIGIWFFTGDIDVDTHEIIPKPFFTRCIIPGTLVQVLDHPTLPDLLPGLLKSILAAFAAIGYSRCIRWILALAPALKMLVFNPLAGFFFQHIEEDEGLMHIAESVGMLTPERKNGMLYGSTGALGIGIGGGKGNFFRKLSSEHYSSQVGLAYDASPPSSRYELQESLVSTETSSTDGTDHLHSSLHQPILAGIPMQNSPLKNRKSVHFGLFDSGSISKDAVDRNVGYSLSSNELHPEKSLNDFNKSLKSASKVGIDKNVSWSLGADELHTSAVSPEGGDSDTNLGYSLSDMDAEVEQLAGRDNNETKVGCPPCADELIVNRNSDALDAAVVSTPPSGPVTSQQQHISPRLLNEDRLHDAEKLDSKLDDTENDWLALADGPKEAGLNHEIPAEMPLEIGEGDLGGPMGANKLHATATSWDRGGR